MELPEANPPTEIQAASTQQKRSTLSPVPETPVKRPISRSNAQAAADYLLDENRIGSVVHTPTKKRRYVQLRSEAMLNNLAVLYSSLFRQRWSLLARSVEKFTYTGTTASNHIELCTQVYLSHWTMDVYRTIRDSLYHLDPIAFIERYPVQIPVHSQEYDNFLSTLTNHIKPTHVTLTYADEIYIPLLSTDMGTRNDNFFGWSRFQLDRDLFNIILQVFEEKKIVKMSPISSDLLGRPSWLFDWSLDNTAYAWFPQEANYSDVDVAVAYIIGVPCTPKIGHSDLDDWKLTTERLEPNQFKPDQYRRITPRRWKGSAEFRTYISEPVHVPNYFDKDPDRFRTDNKGPLQLFENVHKAPTIPEGTGTDIEIADPATEKDHVPASPRVTTRSKSGETSGPKYYRTRVIDHMYYKQVINYFDETSRFTAFKSFNRY